MVFCRGTRMCSPGTLRCRSPRVIGLVLRGSSGFAEFRHSACSSRGGVLRELLEATRQPSKELTKVLTKIAYCTYLYGSNNPSGVTCRRGGNQRPGRRPGVSRAAKNGNSDRELPFLEKSPVPKVVVTCDLGNATKGL